MARISMPSEADLTPPQRLACNEAAFGKRGNVPTPMIAWLRNPELARRAQHLGELLRFDTSLSPRLIELAILVCAQHWKSHHEWTAHKQLALAAGLESNVIDAIAQERTPAFADNKDAIVHRLSFALLSDGCLTPTLYSDAKEALGETALAELVALLGYYCLVSLTLNAFELGLPENRASELEDSECSERPSA